jgi:hypothetical protein
MPHAPCDSAPVAVYGRSRSSKRLGGRKPLKELDFVGHRSSSVIFDEINRSALKRYFSFQPLLFWHVFFVDLAKVHRSFTERCIESLSGSLFRVIVSVAMGIMRINRNDVIVRYRTPFIGDWCQHALGLVEFFPFHNELS